MQPLLKSPALRAFALSFSLLFLWGCGELGTAPGAAPAPAAPRIAYDSVVFDTVGTPASHPVVSSGGPVTSYKLIVVNASASILTLGLTLDSVTGTISGTPEIPHNAPTLGWATSGTTYFIQASGPGGKDTAAIYIEVGWDTPPDTLAGIALTVNLSGSRNILAKSAALRLKTLVITLTSSVLGDADIRDTISAGSFGFTESMSQSATISKIFAVKPFRTWTVAVKTLDTRDSTVHEGSASTWIGIGDTAAVTVNGLPGFEGYSVRLALPDSVRSSTSINAQAIRFTRIRVSLDSMVVRDTTKAGYFAASPTQHSVGYDYVRPTSHHWKVELFSDLSGWDNTRPVYSGTVTPAASQETANITLVWTGPGSVESVTAVLQKSSYTTVNTPGLPPVVP